MSYYVGCISDCIGHSFHTCSAVTLAFEKMRTLYARSLHMKFRNVYQQKEIEKWMMHFKSTFTTRFIKQFQQNKMMFANDTRFPFIMLACLRWSFASPHFEMSRFLCKLCASRSWFCMWLNCYMRDTTQTFALTLSFPRVINITFLLQPHQKYYITQNEELDFS